MQINAFKTTTQSPQQRDLQAWARHYLKMSFAVSLDQAVVLHGIFERSSACKLTLMLSRQRAA